MRERGYYRSQVTYERQPVEFQTSVGVTFHVTPNEPARISDVSVNIDGLAKPIDLDALRLKKAGLYSRDRLTADVTKIRSTLRSEKFVAPELDDPKVVYDSDANTISVAFSGQGRTDSRRRHRHCGQGRERDQHDADTGASRRDARLRGDRRGRAATREFVSGAGLLFCEGHAAVLRRAGHFRHRERGHCERHRLFLCSMLSSSDLSGHKVEIKYNVALDRRLKLTEIRIHGTDKLPVNEVQTVLGSQEANALGVIPVLGYGRGYTSERILAEDELTVRSLMAGLGYRDAQVHAVQGVSPNGDNLIVTFEVEEGPPTVVTDVEITGNSAISTDELKKQFPAPIAGRNFSQARNRNAAQTLTKYYADQGYYDARVVASTVEAAAPKADEERHVKIVFPRRARRQKGRHRPRPRHWQRPHKDRGDTKGGRSRTRRAAKGQRRLRERAEISTAPMRSRVWTSNRSRRATVPTERERAMSSSASRNSLHA